MPDPQVSFAIVARNAAGAVLADVQLDLEKVADRATRSGGAMGGLGAAAERGGVGVRKMENALQNMAGRLVGIEGPAAKVLETVLAFGVGGTAVAGFAAGFVGMTKVIDMLNESAAESYDRLAAVLAIADKLGRLPTQDALVNVLTAQTANREAREHLARLQAGDLSVGERLRIAGADIRGDGQKEFKQMLAEATANVENSEKAIPKLQKVLKDLHTEEADYWKAVLPQIRESNELWNDQADAAKKYLTYVTASGVALFEHQITQPDRDLARPVTLPTPGNLDWVMPGVRDALSGPNATVKAWEKNRTASQKAVDGVNMATSALTLLGSVAGSSGNRIGQALLGVGGLVSALPGAGPFVGAGIGIGGALINLLGGSGKRVPVSIEADNTNRNRAYNVTNNYYGDASRRGEAAQERQDASRRDAIDRLPGGSTPWGQ